MGLKKANKNCFFNFLMSLEKDENIYCFLWSNFRLDIQ